MLEDSVSFSDQIALQLTLCPDPSTQVIANADHARHVQLLHDVSLMLCRSGLEKQAIDMAFANNPAARESGAANRERLARAAVQALRMETLRLMEGNPSFRAFSTDVAHSPLKASFCGLRELDGIRGSSKSTLDRRSKLFSPQQWRLLNQTLTEVCGNSDLCGEIGLDEPLEMGVCLIDSTCLEANIHFPVDWVLLRDVTVTLVKALKLMRGENILCRMEEGPEALARKMSRLCIAMTHAGRGPKAKAERKALLREMKPLLRRIGAHARRHLDKLLGRRAPTRWSQRQVQRIRARVEQKLGQIETVIKQAHERIIGGRPVADKDKVLSVHEAEVHVIVRGKAGKRVEFGNTLLISENEAGLITDWELYRERAPSEPKQLQASLARQTGYDLDEPVEAVVTDRGFASKATTRHLEEAGVFDATCPRDAGLLRERMGQARFARLQRRRASTEARIAILCRGHLGGRARSKGYVNRARLVGAAVLAHNLALLSRLLSLQRLEASALAA